MLPHRPPLGPSRPPRIVDGVRAPLFHAAAAHLAARRPLPRPTVAAAAAADGDVGDGRRRRRPPTAASTGTRRQRKEPEQDSSPAPAPPTAQAQAVAAAVKSAKKMRRGPFAGLIQDLHADMVSPGSPAAGGGAAKKKPAAAMKPKAVAPPPLPPPPPPTKPRSASPKRSTTAGGARSAPPPVLKGGLALPGGPLHSALRRHVVAPPSPPSPASSSATLLPLVVVEGDADAAAVHRAAPTCPCYVCDGTRAMRPHAKQELDALAAITVAGGGNGNSDDTSTTVSVPQQPHKVELIVLTDPDERGRELRAFLDAAFAAAGARARHAFVPEAAATKTEGAGGGNHEVGNRGIEHAPPKAVKAALEAARPSHPTGRKAFTPEWARERGLAGAFEGAPHDGGEASRRRRDLCRALGLGQCSSAQMLSALNRYFDEDVVESAIEKL